MEAVLDTGFPLAYRDQVLKLCLEFLKRNNKVDMLILKNTKDALEPRSSIYHTALTLHNVFMHAGTTSDFFAAAAIGVIHKGHFQENMNTLGSYLPAQGAEGSTGSAAYSEGGALYALRLVIAGCGSGQEVENYLRNLLKNSISEVVQHGAALGLGIAGMGGKSMEAYDDLKTTLFTNSAVAGEAAGYTMGSSCSALWTGQAQMRVANTPNPLPGLSKGVISRMLEVQDLNVHILEAGLRDAPLILLLHGFPELAFSWHRLILPLAALRYHVVAPASDARGYGRTTPRDPSEPVVYDDDLRQYRQLNLGHDIVVHIIGLIITLISALGHTSVAALVRHDFGSTLTGNCVETQHKKIIRGLAISLALIFYGCQEEADDMVKLLMAEKDSILRYGDVYTLVLVYVGTSDNSAIRQLLHVAVSDTSDDVRRAAVTSLAFLLFKIPSKVPGIVQLLSESYNTHVRCGPTLALSIACAGTGLQDAVDILEPMTCDSVDFAHPPPSAKTTRTASSVALAAKRYTGGGGILILADTCPDEEPDYIEFETAPVAPAAAPTAAQNPALTTAGRHIALDKGAPEADPPEAFEYPFDNHT
ncbi:hypothetical protein V8D89_012132 [Ganoderma adspersum]